MNENKFTVKTFKVEPKESISLDENLELINQKGVDVNNEQKMSKLRDLLEKQPLNEYLEVECVRNGEYMGTTQLILEDNIVYEKTPYHDANFSMYQFADEVWYKGEIVE